MKLSFYCVNFNDENRRSKMIERFNNQNINLEFVNPVYNNDERLNIECIKNNNELKRIWSIMLQHLDLIQHFISNTDNDYF
jgi:hypothetical protein